MKTRLLIYFAFALATISCDKQDTLVSLPEAHAEKRLSSTFTNKGDGVTSFDCIELTTTNWLMADAQIVVPKVSKPGAESTPVIADGRGPGSTYVITASGDGVSELLARCTTEVAITYNSASRSISGSVTSRFYFGEVLEHKLNGIAIARQSAKECILTLDLQHGSLQEEGGTSYLDSGSMTIVIPTDLSKPFQLQLNSAGLYCLAVID